MSIVTEEDAITFFVKEPHSRTSATLGMYADLIEERDGKREAEAKFLRLLIEFNDPAGETDSAKAIYKDDRRREIELMLKKPDLNLGINTSNVHFDRFSGEFNWSMKIEDAVKAEMQKPLAVFSTLLNIRFPELQSYGIREGEDQPNPVIALAQSPNLACMSRLDFSGVFLGDDVVNALVDSPYAGSLTRLNLRASGLTTQAVVDLADSPNFTHLTHLDLGANSLNIEASRAIAQSGTLTSVTDLDLSRSVVDVHALAHSSNAGTLRTLCLSNCRVGHQELEALATSPHLQQLTSLDLSVNNMRDEGVAILANSSYLSSLRELNLAGNNLTHRSVSLLSEVANFKLTGLNLSGNVISNIGLTNLLNSPKFDELTKLNLAYARISPNTPELMQGFSHLPHLSELNLSSNKISNHAIEIIANLPTSSSLTDLNLDHCGLTDASASVLAQSPHLKNLRYLSLNGNNIGITGARALVNTQDLDLTSLEMGNNRLSRSTTDQLTVTSARMAQGGRFLSVHASKWDGAGNARTLEGGATRRNITPRDPLGYGAHEDENPVHRPLSL